MRSYSVTRKGILGSQDAVIMHNIEAVLSTYMLCRGSLGLFLPRKGWLL